jgi:hypothetical protein
MTKPSWPGSPLATPRVKGSAARFRPAAEGRPEAAVEDVPKTPAATPVTRKYLLVRELRMTTTSGTIKLRTSAASRRSPARTRRHDGLLPNLL